MDRRADNEDWLRTMTWEVRDTDGRPVDSLVGLAAALGVGVNEAARKVMTEPFGQPAPRIIKIQAKRELAGPRR